MDTVKALQAAMAERNALGLSIAYMVANGDAEWHEFRLRPEVARFKALDEQVIDLQSQAMALVQTGTVL